MIAMIPFRFFFLLFFSKITDLVYHRRDWSKQKRRGGRKRTINERARSGRNDASIILSFFRIVNCNSPNDRMEYNGNTPDAFSHKKFLNVSRLITRETFRSRNEILCRVISVRCFNARKRKKRYRIP